MCKIATANVSLFVLAVVVGAFTLGNTECTPPEFPKPPFDATGLYDGVWWGNSNDKGQEVLACPLAIALAHDTYLNYPADHGVRGTVTVDYSCIELPEWVEEIPQSTVEVTGLMADDGTLTLASGGCTTALCLVLALSGPAQDLDGDGYMDQYAGSWSFTFLLAGVQPFGFTGQFDVQQVG